MSHRVLFLALRHGPKLFYLQSAFKQVTPHQLQTLMLALLGLVLTIKHFFDRGFIGLEL